MVPALISLDDSLKLIPKYKNFQSDMVLSLYNTISTRIDIYLKKRRIDIYLLIAGFDFIENDYLFVAKTKSK